MTNKLLINIGLSSDEGAVHPLEAIQALYNSGFAICTLSFRPSDTEMTLVASLRTDEFPPGVDLAAAVLRLCTLLRQDCVALYSPVRGRGVLTGPRAEKWGAFDPARFILLNGARLSVHLLHQTVPPLAPEPAPTQH